MSEFVHPMDGYTDMVNKTENWSTKPPPTPEQQVERLESQREKPRMTKKQRKNMQETIKREMDRRRAIRTATRAKVASLSRQKELTSTASNTISSFLGARSKKHKDSKRKERKGETRRRRRRRRRLRFANRRT